MDSRDNPVYLSFSCGNWFMTHVRMSVLVPLIVVGLCFQLHDWRLGLLFGAILIVSLLIHEFCHILAVRMTGGVGNEILIWPLGGLALVQPAGNFRSQFLTPAAGPLANLALCAIVATPLWRAGLFPKLLNPIVFPPVGLHEPIADGVFALIFWGNWILLLANLLPVFPLDGIRMVLAVLKNRTDVESAAETAIRISFVAAAVIMLVGLFVFDSAWIVFFGALAMFLSLVEWFQMRTADTLDDSFMGYDFSQGYTSLERSNKPNQPARRRRGLLETWRERRRIAKEQRARLDAEQAQQQLDAILEKVHQNGISSLTDAERRQLIRASARLRDRDKHPEQ
ncbi:MAG TPA: site-2 protease family protein [Planctomycetaceae bacterium]|jgi:Zn-dependent protease|nr:site-2 protease family protein [Planctomycetaceae bacterium]